MAEEHKYTHSDGVHAAHDDHGHEEHDPLHHIKDKVIFALDSNGAIQFYPYDHHGHKKSQHYAPMTLGPVKLEFTKHMVDITVVATFLFFAISSVARKILTHAQLDKAPKGPLANAVEALLIWVRDDVVTPAGGKHVAPYTPLFLTYFFFILTTNLSGMIPEFGSGTGNIGVTAALGGSILVLLTLLGMIKQGPFGYFLHMVPPGTPLPLWPLLFIIEFIGPIIKCFVLCVRLFANMIAGHLVISNVLSLAAIGQGALLPSGLAVLAMFVGVPLAIGISGLEILVCFIQAYVFTMLAAIFIGAAVHPEH